MAATTGRMLISAWGGDLFHVVGLGRHPLPDHTFHPGKADVELVLQQFTHATDPAVAQVVDVVHGTHAVGQGVQIVDGSENVVP